MLPFFPEPYPGELLYSTLCRLKQRLGMPTYPFSLMLGLGEHRMVEPLFPFSSANKVVSLLPKEWSITAKGLLERHTILPFYRPFNPPERFQRWMATAMERTGRLRMKLGYRLDTGFLKFCVRCMEDDQKSGIEPYFRRVHQVAGVGACPSHGIYLTSLGKKEKLDFTSLINLPGVAEASSKPAHPLLVTLAQDIETCPDVFSNLDEEGIFTRVSTLLANNGIWWQLPESGTRTHDRISSYLGDAVQEIPYVPRYGGTLWGLMRTTSPTHPLGILLLLRAFGASPQLLAASTPGPQMKRGWPCRNPLCDDYRRTVISKIDESGKGTFRWGQKVALTCPKCSFSYLVKKTSAILGRNFTQLHVARFGAVWIKEFRLLWQDPHCSIHRIRTKMGFRMLPYYLLFQAAEECELPLDRGGMADLRKPLQRYLEAAEQKRDRLIQAKENLSKLRASHPELQQIKLRKRAWADYSFTLSYDRCWLTTEFGRKKNSEA